MLCCRWIDIVFHDFHLDQGFPQNVVELYALADQSDQRKETTNGSDGTGGMLMRLGLYIGNRLNVSFYSLQRWQQVQLLVELPSDFCKIFF